MLCVLVNIKFQVLFHSPPGVLFTFPSRYFSTIGHQVVFRLGGWAPRLPGRFLVSARTPDTVSLFRVSLTGLSPSMVDLPKSFCYTSEYTLQSILHTISSTRLSLAPVGFPTPFDYSLK